MRLPWARPGDAVSKLSTFPGLVLAALWLAPAHADTPDAEGFAPPDGFAAPTVAMRWSSDGYLVGSAVGRWNDGIYVIVRFPRAQPYDVAALLLDIGYEPHWQPDKMRSHEPVAVTLRLRETQWRADTPQLLPPLANDHPRQEIFAGHLHRFTFGPDPVAAMLAASDAAPRSHRDLMGEDPQGVLHVEILFRDADGGIASSNDILEIDSGTCEARCQPRLSLAGFAEAYNGSAADTDE